jgi:hypothetical protein
VRGADGVRCGWIGLSRERRHESPPEDRLRVTAFAQRRKAVSVDRRADEGPGSLHQRFSVPNEQAAAAGQSTEGGTPPICGADAGAYACEDERARKLPQPRRACWPPTASPRWSIPPKTPATLTFCQAIPKPERSPRVLSLKDGALSTAGQP